MFFTALLSGVLVWLLAARRRREVEKAAERAIAEALALREQLIANLTHELVTPLTVIDMVIAMLRRPGLGQRKTREMVETLSDASSQLERIVDLIVTYALIRSGSLQPKTDRIEVTNVVRETVANMERRHPGRRFNVRIDDTLPASVGDGKLLSAAVEQLLDNAVKFDKTGGDIEVFVRRSQDADATDIVIRDRGIGMSPATIAKIFEEMIQGDGSSTRTFGGVGLGLPFARAVARLHGGDVTVASVEGMGSTFTLRVRRAAAHPLPVLGHSHAA